MLQEEAERQRIRLETEARGTPDELQGITCVVWHS